MCASYVSMPVNGIHSCGDEENEEMEFEGWLQVGPQSNGLIEGAAKCQGGGSCHRSCGRCGEQPVYRKQCADHGQPAVKQQRPCGSKGCVNIIKRRGNTPCRCKAVEVSHQEADDVFYVNNKQHAPKILVQKPQTVIVRNHSRPPIVVQQPPPNVIVKNDPPQPIFVQNCPPNVIVKNERPSSVQKTPVMPVSYPQVVQTGYPPNYMKPCNCGRHHY